MRVLIVESEASVADSIETGIRSLLGSSLRSTHTVSTIVDASLHISGNVIDLCLLDTNLDGRDGFGLLQNAKAHPFPTIVISASAERACEAFEYGVVDFIVKPFSQERLRRALEKLLCWSPGSGRARYLISRTGNRNVLVPVGEIAFLRAARYLVEAHKADGKIALLERPLSALEWILPDHFFRIHRSWTANLDYVASFGHIGGNCYVMRMKDGSVLPLSRPRYPLLCRKFHK